MKVTAAQQPEKFIANLRSAKIPEEAPQGVFQTLGRAVGLGSPKPQRHGIPHGAMGVRIRVKNLYVDEHGVLRFCYSHSYQALHAVPEGDGLPYPSDVDLEVKCPVKARMAYLDGEMVVSINGLISATVESLEPART